MNWYRAKTPSLLKRFFPNRLWNYSADNNEVYLTFDDGPIPEVTPWVLDLLASYKAKATFFCIGDNIQKHPALFQEVMNQGHRIGNHTFHHLNGWSTPTDTYMEDVWHCDNILKKQAPIVLISTMLFRPPYGKLKPSQAHLIEKAGYKIVMWDVLSADFDTQISNAKCLTNVLDNIRPGSIVVFHDSLKAAEKLKAVLPQVLDHIDRNRWTCAPIK